MGGTCIEGSNGFGLDDGICDCNDVLGVLGASSMMDDLLSALDDLRAMAPTLADEASVSGGMLEMSITAYVHEGVWYGIDFPDSDVARRMV